MNKQTFIPAHEVEGIRNRAIKRAEDRVEEREHLRLEIKSRELLTGMHDIFYTLISGVEVSPFKDIDEDGREVNRVVPLSRDRIASLKAAADVSDKLLKKVLPDLKQIEMVDPGGKGEGRILENIELANRMRLYIESLNKRGVVIPIRPGDQIVEAEFTAEQPLDFLK